MSLIRQHLQNKREFGPANAIETISHFIGPETRKLAMSKYHKISTAQDSISDFVDDVPVRT